MKDYDFFQDYVTIKSEQLISMMEELVSKMNCNKCNVRHFKKWEAMMTSFREEYHTFQSNLLNQLNDVQDKQYAKQLEANIEPVCEKLENQYELLANLYLTKCNEIKAKTTYFETCNCKEPTVLEKMVSKIKLPSIKITIQKRK